MKRPQLTNKELILLRDDVRDIWDSSSQADKLELPNIWLAAIANMLTRRGDQIVTKELRAEESRIDDAGLQDEYFDALLAVLAVKEMNLMTFLSATPEQRIKACEIVRIYETEATKQERFF